MLPIILFVFGIAYSSGKTMAEKIGIGKKPMVGKTSIFDSTLSQYSAIISRDLSQISVRNSEKKSNEKKTNMQTIVVSN